MFCPHDSEPALLLRSKGEWRSREVTYEPDGAPEYSARRQVVEGMLAWLCNCRGFVAMQPCQERMEKQLSLAAQPASLPSSPLYGVSVAA
jgi:hypothetical protein